MFLCSFFPLHDFGLNYVVLLFDRKAMYNDILIDRQNELCIYIFGIPVRIHYWNDQVAIQVVNITDDSDLLWF